MTRRQLFQLIESGESLTVEFKQRFSSHEKIAKEIIAFANTRGGFVIFGVNDDKSICGVHSEKGVVELVTQVLNEYIEPRVEFDIHYFDVNDVEVVIYYIKESKNKPHRLQDYKFTLDPSLAQVFVRVNDKSVPASKEMIKLLQAQTTDMKLSHYEVGKNEKIVFEYLDKHETITVKELAEIANLSSRRASRTLIKLVRANLLFIHTKDNGEDFFTYTDL